MILTKVFDAIPAVTEHFNAPANAALRLVSVLPPDARTQGFTALYETPPDPVAELETERRELLEAKVLALIQLDDERKAKANFPRVVIEDGLSVPLAIVSNRLGQIATFKALDNADRAQWIRAHAPAAGFTVISPDEAREFYGCAAELVRLLDD